MKAFVIPKAIAAPAAPAKANKKRALPTCARQAGTKQRLVDAGGKRVPFNLSAEDLAHIEAIKAREQLGGRGSQLRAVRAALRHYADAQATPIGSSEAQGR